MKKVVSLTLAIVAAAFVAAAPAGATDTVSLVVPHTVVVKNGVSAPQNCRADTFAQWKDVPGTFSAAVSYTVHISTGGTRGESASAQGPLFNDSYANIWTVDPGFHWVALGFTSKSGTFDGDACDDVAAAARAADLEPLVVTLQVTESPACDKAQSAIAKQQKSVKKYTAKVKHSSGTKRKANKKKLASAKSALKAAKKSETKNCPHA